VIVEELDNLIRDMRKEVEGVEQPKIGTFVRRLDSILDEYYPRD
jgi:hypothetical protein